MSRYAVIMAGGPGSRLWPMSRKTHPKQLLPFGPGGKSLLRVSMERLLGPFTCEQIYVIAGADQLAAIAKELPELPVENLIGEPMARDTANAIGLACAILAEKDPDASIGVFTADHIIEPIDRFQDAVEAALTAIESNADYLGTFGVKPTWPHPGLGYIHRGDPIGGGDIPAFQVRRFKEKPDPATAEGYVSSGEYYWNSGMFVWKAATITAALEKLLPENYLQLATLARSVGSPDWDSLAFEVYENLEKISIDFAVMEKAEKVLVVELACNWADVGNWCELKTVTGEDDKGNATLADEVALIESNNNIIASSEKGHLIATIGVDDLIVIHTADATLVCAKDKAQKIKELVASLNADFGGRYT